MSLITLLETYKYLILFPLSIVEGPILTVIVGFLTTLNIFDFYFVLPIVIAGDVIGDSIMYALGRFGDPLIQKYGHYVGLTEDKIASARAYFGTHQIKSVSMSKLIHGVGFIGLLAAGSLRVPYKKFFFTALTISILQSILLFILGIFFGYAYVTIEHYLTTYAAVISVVFLFGVFILFLKGRFKKTRT